MRLSSRLKPWPRISDFEDDANIETTEYAIGGKLVKVTARIDDSETVSLSNDEYKWELKRRLAQKLANYMLDNNMIEFTSMQNPADFGTIVAARAYVAPNDQVNILRLHGTKR
jgi:hypothetical protein